jgi:hypothetical protein
MDVPALSLCLISNRSLCVDRVANRSRTCSNACRPHLRRDWAHPSPHLRRDCARRRHICAGTALAAATSAPDVAALAPCRICTATRLTPATLHGDCSHPLAHLRQEWARPLPRLHRDSPHRCYICDCMEAPTNETRPHDARRVCTSASEVVHISTKTGPQMRRDFVHRAATRAERRRRAFSLYISRHEPSVRVRPVPMWRG